MPSTIRGSDNFDTAGGNAVKAWVNFNGTGTVAIRASFNVSSITDNGTGDYTINFTNALPDANFVGVAENNANGGSMPVASQTSTTYRFSTLNSSFVASDYATNMLSFFR